MKKHWYHFLAPRHWPLWLTFGLLRLIAYLPYSAILKLGAGLGKVVPLFLPKRRRIVEVNLRLCFPDLSPVQRETILRDHFAAIGIGLLETAYAWWASDKTLRKLLTVHGLEHLEQAKQQKRGILLASGHFTSMELAGRMMSFYLPVRVMYRPQNNPLFEWMSLKLRHRYFAESIAHADVRSMLRNLNDGNSIFYLPDQDYGRKNSVFAPFFGISTASITGTMNFVKRTNALLVPFSYYHDLNTKTYHIHFFPQLDHFPSDPADDIFDATRINQTLEAAILQNPEQYFWQHRRFKTRPEGEAYPY